MDDDNEYLKLPVEDQCVHKNWKARVHGYEAATKVFQQLEEKAPEWGKYTPLIKKFVTDSNAVAQEKGLEAALAYVENAASAVKTAQDVLNGIVAKCLGSARAKTKDLGMQIILMYVEIEKYEVVQETLVGALSSQKNPKVVAACVATLSRILYEFGLKVINVKALLKAVPSILEDRDKNVREEGKVLMIELYRWIGQALKPQLSNLKPIQVSELEAEFDKIGHEKPVQVRFLRSQQDLKAKFEAKAAGIEDGDEEEEEQGAPEIDPLDLLEPVEVLSKLPKDFYDKCEAKKWQERKEAMEDLEKLVSHPKLEPGDYGDIVRAIKKIIAKDTNVNVIANAGKNLAALANGLKKKFSPYAVSCVSTILDKFKEKKANVVAAMREAIDAIYPSTNLEAIQEDALAALENKNPSIKTETASFLARSFTKCTPTILTKKLLKGYVAVLLKTFNDSDANVRDASAEALGTAMKVVGEKGIMPFLGDMEPLKMAKIKECCEKAVLQVKIPGSKIVKLKEQPKPIEAAKSGPVIRKPTGGPGKPSGSQSSKQAGAGPPKTATKKVPQKSSASEEKIEKELSQEEVDEQFLALFPAQVVSELTDSNWKMRLAAMEQVLEKIRFLEKGELPVQVILRSITKKPGLKDTNFQVLKLKMEGVKVLAEKGDFSKKSVEFCLNEVTEKLGDVKNSATAAECLTAMTEAVGLDWISQELVSFVLNQKNPKVHAEAAIWLSNAIREFGFVVQPKLVIDFCKKSVQASNPAIRAAGISLAGTLYMYMGAPLRVFFEGEKPALLQTLDAEFDKHASSRPPAPVRGLKLAQGQQRGPENSKVESEPAESVNIEDLVPRTDVSSHFTGQIITELCDKNWKVRNEALQKVETVIKEAKFIAPNLGELPSALAQRLTDSNKILVQTGLSICQQLAVAMGPNIRQHIRTLVPGILQSLSDNKANVRQAAITTLDTLAEQCGIMKDFFEGEMIADALKGGNPYLKADLLAWVADKLGNALGINKEDLKGILPQLYACVEDRNADVRKGAQEAVLPFMILLGYEPMMRAAQNLKPASKNTIVGLLDKTRPNLPVKPQPPPPTSSGFATTARPKSANPKLVLPIIDDDNAATVRGHEKKPASARVPSKSRLPSANAKSIPGRTKKDEDIDISPLLQHNSLKSQRINDEMKLKCLKWNFVSPREEFVDQLKDQMTVAGFNKSLMQNMFHTDFKMHIRAIESLQEDLNNGNIEAQKSNLDLLLKWMTIRFFDTNPSVLIKGLDYLSCAFNALSQDDYKMHDLETSCFVPYLITKIGDPKDTVKNSVHQIIRQICRVAHTPRLMLHLMDGLKSKNARQRTECLDELGYFIENVGSVVYQGTPFLKEIAKQIADRDNSVRNAALNCVVQAYFVEGDKVRNMIGHLAEKDLAMLEERIKRAGKNRPPAQTTATKNTSPDSKLPQSRIGRPGSAPVLQNVNNNLPKELESKEEKARGCHEEFQNIAEDLENEIGKNIGAHPVDINDVLSKLKKADFDDVRTEAPRRETSIPRPSPTKSTLEPAAHRVAAIDLLISQVLDDNPYKCTQALQQIEQSLKQDPMMIAKVDSVIRACTQQLIMNGEENARTQLDSLKVYQSCLRTLLALYSSDLLGSKGSSESLEALMPTLIGILVDGRFEGESKELSSVFKQTNMLILRIVEKSDHTAITSTLLRLLLDSVDSKGPNSKYVDLVQKCIWKVIRLLPEWIPSLKLEVILQDIHDFMKAYPNASWKGRESDMPIRTVKTILHTIVKDVGRDILDLLNGIKDLNSSELYPYLKKIFSQGGLTSKEPRSSESSISNVSTDPSGTLSKKDQDRLTTIVRKIGTRDLTREGLSEFYDFKLEHPEADLAPFFGKCSEFFRAYIERGLLLVEKERKALGKKSVSTESSSIPVIRTKPDQVNMYMERLKNAKINSGLSRDTENREILDNASERLRQIKLESRSMNDITSLRLPQTDNISTNIGEKRDKSPDTKSLSYQSPKKVPSQGIIENGGGATQITSRLEQLRSRLAFVKQTSQH
ncbi:cytoskeleton-associated protein 5-like [Artemia franciscana]|uniref:cytoskeleton-associated protein 5-like n=1 Tax=Artemia franciscana TaxID=6661 RepID=UPI0032DB2566